MFYGSDHIMLYNETYVELLGSAHPCMGVSARIALQEVWADFFEPLAAKNMQGEAVENIDYYVSVVRNGYLEETYFSCKFMPIIDSEGATVGHYQPLVESVRSPTQEVDIGPSPYGPCVYQILTKIQTRSAASHRRSQTLLELSEEVPQVRSSDSFWALMIEILSRNDKDIPFALLYSIDLKEIEDAQTSTTARSPIDHQCTLRGSSVGGSSAGPAHLNLQDSHGLAPYLREALLARKPITVDLSKHSPAAGLVQDVVWQGFGVPSKLMTICPLVPAASTDDVLGFVVMGLSPKRPYDAEYKQSILVASRLLSATLTSITSHEDDIRCRERTIAKAEAMKFELTRQLVESQKEAERNASKFQRFAERCDVGIFIIRKSDGVYTYRNEAWFTILDPTVDRGIDLADTWGALIDDEYAPVGQASFAALLETKQHQYDLHPIHAWQSRATNYTLGRSSCV